MRIALNDSAGHGVEEPPLEPLPEQPAKTNSASNERKRI